MDHFEVEVGNVDEPTCLSAIKRLWLAEVGEVFVIREYLYWKGGTMKIMAPRFQGTDDCKEFSVIDVVVALSWGEGL